MGDKLKRQTLSKAADKTEKTDDLKKARHQSTREILGSIFLLICIIAGWCLVLYGYLKK